jgi:hypothetical protein
LRLGQFLEELEFWGNLTRAIEALYVPFYKLGIAWYYIYNLYATVGVRWFGGKISKDNFSELQSKYEDYIDDNWVYLNYNDYASGFSSLFGIMALNDWQFIVMLYSACTDESQGMYILVFFISFLISAYFVVLNILVAFIIDAYSQLQEQIELEEKSKKQLLLEHQKHQTKDKSLLNMIVGEKAATKEQEDTILSMLNNSP